MSNIKTCRFPDTKARCTCYFKATYYFIDFITNFHLSRSPTFLSLGVASPIPLATLLVMCLPSLSLTFQYILNELISHLHPIISPCHFSSLLFESIALLQKQRLPLLSSLSFLLLPSPSFPFHPHQCLTSPPSCRRGGEQGKGPPMGKFMRPSGLGQF